MLTRANRSVSARLVAIGVVAIATSATAFAATGQVSVELNDAATNAKLAGMQVRPSQTKVRAGLVSFAVTNRSTTLVHEMLVIRLDRPGQSLPYDAKEDKIIEERTQDLGEVSELDPGKSGTLQVMLTPGVYALLCNQPGHYHAGMTAMLTVTP